MNRAGFRIGWRRVNPFFSAKGEERSLSVVIQNDSQTENSGAKFLSNHLRICSVTDYQDNLIRALSPVPRLVLQKFTSTFPTTRQPLIQPVRLKY